MPTAGSLSFWLSASGNLALIITVGFLIFRNKEKRVVSLEPPELAGTFDVRPAGRDFNAEACDAKHLHIINTLAGHDGQIKDLWYTIRKEDFDIRTALANAIRDFDKIVNRIDGTLSAVEKSNDMILKKLLG